MSIELRVQWVQPTDTPIIGILKISSLNFFFTFCRNSNCLRAEKRNKCSQNAYVKQRGLKTMQ